MAILYPQYTHPVRADGQVVFVDLLSVPVGYELDDEPNVTLGEYLWVGGGSDVVHGERDLLVILAKRITELTGATTTLELTDDGLVYVESASPLTFYFTRADFTLDPSVLGSDGSANVTLAAGGALGYQWTSPFRSSCVWQPGRVWNYDTLDIARPVGAQAITADGMSRGYRLGVRTGRVITHRGLARERVVSSLAPAPWDCLSEHVQEWMAGGRVRVYPDVGVEAHSNYVFAKTPEPTLAPGLLPRYDVTFDLTKSQPELPIEYGMQTYPGAISAGAYLDAAQIGATWMSHRFVWSFWVKPSKEWILVERNGGGAGVYGPSVETTAGQGLRVYIPRTTSDNSTYQTTSPGTVPWGVWTHVLISVDVAESGSSKMRIKINGVTVATATSGTWDHTAVAVPSGEHLRFDTTSDSVFDDFVVIAGTSAHSTASSDALYGDGLPVDIRETRYRRTCAAWWRFERDFSDSCTGEIWGAGHHLTPQGVPAFVNGAYTP